MSHEPVVTIDQGTLRGKYCEGHGRVRYYSFQGIPYATPPVGNLRFKAPLPPSAWEGVRNATKEANRSVYRSQTQQIIGNEDCLYLNVYTKDLPEEGTTVLKPVMFWIHGGGFITGSGNSDLFAPDFLLKEDVILVTINYRLGVLGFLSLEDPSLGVPGNAGLKDMVMALHWVQSNIEKFNGNPNCVTIFGESSGGAAVHLLVVSPMAKGLFHRAIAQSGTAVSPWAHCVRRGFKFAEVLGKKLQSEEEVLNFLRVVPPEKLIESLERVTELNDKLSFRVVGPIVETPSDEYEAFLPEDPEALLLSGKINHVPIIIGHNSADGMIYASKQFQNRLVPMDFSDPEDLIPRDMGLERGTLKSINFGVKIKKQYYGLEKPSRTTIAKYIILQTDINFSLMTNNAVRLQRVASSEPVFVYRFSFDSPSNLYKKFLGMTVPGAAHGDELTYLFKTNYPMKFGELENETITRMIKLWTTFARTGNPNYEPLIWSPVQEDKYCHLDIGATLQPKDTAPDLERMDFWYKLYAELKSEL